MQQLTAISKTSGSLGCHPVGSALLQLGITQGPFLSSLSLARANCCGFFYKPLFKLKYKRLLSSLAALNYCGCIFSALSVMLEIKELDFNQVCY